MSGFAWVTLATNDSYSLGALVLAHSLKRVNTAHQLAILITPGVSQAMRTQLSAVYNLIEVVDVLDSKDEANLTLLARPELGITFTKLHCWRLTQFNKCVFLDADTLVLQNCDELFDREEFSAAPDAGWPDCFNSGVFVYRPSNDTFKQLMDFAVVHGSFDGGDQGLLNLFYKDWSVKDISKHLPFIYNMCSTATYSYLPAFKQYGQDLKIIHFIGSSKPWLQVFDTETGLVRVSGESHSIGSFVQLWWDLFCTYVHTSLSTEMTRHRLSSCYVYTSSSSNTTFPNPSISPPPSNPRIRSPPPFIEYDDSDDNTPYVFNDPWDEFTEYYLGSVTNENSSNYAQTKSYYSSSEISHNEYINNQHNNNYSVDCDINVNNINLQNTLSHDESFESNLFENQSNSNVSGGGDNEIWIRPTKRDSFLQSSSPSFAEPPLPQNQHASPQPTSPPSSLVEHHEPELELPQYEPAKEPDGGLAGALATVTLGTPLSTEQTAFQEHLRRQCWEQGNIDYMGRDSFDNIWQKISETLNLGQSPTEAANEIPPPEAIPIELLHPQNDIEVTPTEIPPSQDVAETIPLSPASIEEDTLKSSSSPLEPPVVDSPKPTSIPEVPSTPPTAEVNPQAPPTPPYDTEPPSVQPPFLSKSGVTPLKPEQPSTPTITSPTPPTSPPVDPFDTPHPTKLKVEVETPGTPPTGSQPSSPSDEPPIPPKRKGNKSTQDQPKTQTQPKGGKPAKGKK